MNPAADLAAIDAIVAAFYAAFTTRADGPVDLTPLRALFLPQAIVVRHCGTPEIYDVAQFIEPRQQLLNSGRLVDFAERELSATTEVRGGIAQRLSVYTKSGTLDGVAFAARGAKTFQFVYVDDAWKIAAAAWDDERPGFTLQGLAAA